MKRKIGIYLCKCGSGVSDKIDYDKVAAEIKSRFGEVHCATCELLCSESGKEFLEKDLKSNGIERAVVAACSPRDHEATFMRCMENAGCNPYLLQLVNVREQVAWVTPEKEKATAKATQYLLAALGRVERQEPLHKKELDVSSDVLIVGAGPAGLRAALTLAEAGRKVTLVEKTPLIGGLPVRYEDTFPKMECGPCMLEPVMGDILHGPHHENIELVTLAEVTEVVGFYGNFTATIRRRPRYVDEVKCIGCAECLTPCPSTATNPYNCDMSERKAIAFPFAGALPNAPYIDESLCLRSKGDDCHLCKDVCPVEGTILFDERETVFKRNVGAILLAIGADLYDARKIANLSYGTLPEVYSSLEFERILSSTGPTGAEIKTKDGRIPASVAILHCVGSLDQNHRDYCSGVCCQYAFKFNHLIEKRVPGAKITHFYKELVAPGKEEFELCRHAQHGKTTAMIRYNDIQDLAISADGPQNKIRYRDAHGSAGEVSADMVVLCPAMIGPKDAAKLGAVLEVGCDKAGFFEELHGRMNSSQSKIKGIYLAGTCQAPGDIQKAMNQGMASAGYILSGLIPGKKLEISPVCAEVIEERCAGCRICNNVCPYKAISFNEERKISQVSDVLCQGCGSCVAACPAGAIKGNHFTNDQVFAEIEGMFK